MSDINYSISGLKFHHIGLLVESIEQSIIHYSELFGKENISDITVISSQKVKVCFVRISDESYIELIEPMGEDSTVYNLLKKRISYYHIAYKVKDIRSTVEQLEKSHYKVLDYYNSEAYNGKLSVFVFTPEAHLMELVEE